MASKNIITRLSDSTTACCASLTRPSAGSSKFQGCNLLRICDSRVLLLEFSDILIRDGREHSQSKENREPNPIRLNKAAVAGQPSCARKADRYAAAAPTTQAAIAAAVTESIQ